MPGVCCFLAARDSHLSIKIGMSSRFAYTPPTAGGRKAEARKGREGMACESTSGVQRPDRAESKQGQDDTERSDVSACAC